MPKTFSTNDSARPSAIEKSLAPSILRRYEKLSTPVVYDVLDKMGHPNQALSADIRSLCPAMKVVGVAFTITGSEVSDDSVYGPVAFELFRHISPGNVLVMEGNGHQVAGAWGENASLSAQLAGALGMVTDTGTRDANAIAELEFPTFSRYVSPVFMSGRFAFTDFGCSIAMTGQVGKTVSVTPGDLVIGDRDGVVIVPQDRIKPVLEATEELERIEERIRTDLRAGKDREAVYQQHPKFAHIRKPTS